MICLSLIVRNGGAGLRETLKSCRPVLDSYVVWVDGRTVDDTQKIVVDELGDLPGEVLIRPWPGGFGPARQEALEAAQSFICQAQDAYILWIDSGDTLQFDGSRPTTAPSYRVQVHDCGCIFDRTHLLRARAPWRWQYRVHETLVGGGDFERLSWTVVGAANASSPDKYLRYAKMSELDLQDYPNDPRVIFYAGLNWMWAGHPGRALVCFRQRIALGGWTEEVWYSVFQSARCLETMSMRQAAESEYLRAVALAPHRAEPLRHLARLTCDNSWNEQADRLPMPQALFVEPWAYKS